MEAPVDPAAAGSTPAAAGDLPDWAGHALYEIELAGEIVDAPAKVVASRAGCCDGSTPGRTARDEFTRMCADRAHEIAARTPSLAAGMP